MACKLCGEMNGHNAATCTEGQLAIGRLVKVGSNPEIVPTHYIKITRRSSLNTIASCFVLWSHKDPIGESQAMREAQRIRKLTGWGAASVAMYAPGGAITVLIDSPDAVTLPAELDNEHEIAIGCAA